MTLAEVLLWGRRIGAVRWDARRELGEFEYDPEFAASGIEVAPLVLPLSRGVHRFPQLERASYHGLPGLLADVLPDRFGNALIDAWLASRGRTPDSFDPVERLCYTGKRGMGALEFKPQIGEFEPGTRAVDVRALTELAEEALSDRSAFEARLLDNAEAGAQSAALRSLLRVGTSAGGARAKAVIAWNPETGEVRSGQTADRPDLEPWLIKFDGISSNRDRELESDRPGYGRIEFAYSLMARAAGIEMADCRLFEEGGRAHFATRRFDRTESGGKLHMQSLCAIGHYDFNLPGGTAYEQLFAVIRRLGLGREAEEEQFRRTVFNVLARNQDDHTKNFAFLMDQSGRWFLSPAFDLTYANNPQGAWTARHQLSLRGKRDDFSREDFRDLGRHLSFKGGRADGLFDQVATAVEAWPEFADKAGVDRPVAEAIARGHRRIWLGS